MDSIFKCSFCKKILYNYHDFFKHLKYFHMHESYYKCCHNNCSRTFQNRYKFENHFLRKHKIIEEQICADSEMVEVDEVCSSELPSVIENKKSLDNDLENIPSQTLSPVVFADYMKISALKLCTKLYSNYSLPRNIVQNIVEDVGDMYKDTTSILAKCLDSYSTEQEKPKINQFCNILSKPFHNLETEYKRFQHFENTSLFIKPKTLIVGEKLENKHVASHTIFDYNTYTV